MAQELAKLLELPPESPIDLYKNPAYLDRVKEINTAVATLVYETTEEGRTKAKTDVAAIRKYIKTTDSWTLNIFRSLTDKVKNWRDDFTNETKSLSKTADGILANFETMEAEQLDFILDICITELTSARTLAKTREEFLTKADLSSLIRLSGTLTPNQQLTSKARKFIADIAYTEKADQDKYDIRCTTIKLKSLEADINPPLDPEYIGQAIFASDDEFETRLAALIQIELDRRKLAQQKFAQQQEQENQRKIAEGIRDEKRKAKELEEEEKQILAMAETQQPVIIKTDGQEMRDAIRSMRESAERAPTNEMRRKELAEAEKLEKQANFQLDSRICTVVMTFQMPVKYTCSFEKLKSLFANEVTLSDKAKKALVSIEASDDSVDLKRL